jgi:hypothetical protein
VPISSSRGVLDDTSREPPEAIDTGTSRNGANPTMLFRQKIVFNFPRSPSGKCAGVYLFTPSSDGRTLTMTQPQVDAKFKAVFEKQ